MKRPVRPATASSTVSVRNQTPTPREIVLDASDPFATFSEWASAADEKAYRDL